MDNLESSLILVSIYILQILIVGAYPYYKYRKEYPEYRTVGEFISYMDKTKFYDAFKFAMFFPFLGPIIIIILSIILGIVASIIWIYEKFIKNIKI